MKKINWIRSLDLEEIAELLDTIEKKAIARGKAMSKEEYIEILQEEKQ